MRAPQVSAEPAADTKSKNYLPRAASEGQASANKVENFFEQKNPHRGVFLCPTAVGVNTADHLKSSHKFPMSENLLLDIKKHCTLQPRRAQEIAG